MRARRTRPEPSAALDDAAADTALLALRPLPPRDTLACSTHCTERMKTMNDDTKAHEDWTDRVTAWPPGQRVSGGTGEDYDTGTILQPVGEECSHPMARSRDNVYVAWDSGTRTWAPISELTALT